MTQITHNQKRNYTRRHYTLIIFELIGKLSYFPKIAIRKKVLLPVTSTNFTPDWNDGLMLAFHVSVCVSESLMY